MNNRWTKLALLGILSVLISAPAFAQGTTTSSISGTVVDSGGGAVPGATITATDNARGTTFTTVSSATGDFIIPAITIGTYTVSVSLQGFKTVILSDVVANIGVPAIVRAVLEVGSVSETINVAAASQMVQTQSTTISSTISTREIANSPMSSRSVMDFVVSLPGVNTPSGSRDSTINGLDQSSINITLDGINIQDNTNKTTDGFFALISPRLDAIEEVTVNSAVQGADSAGTGAVQIKFVTRGGSNSFTGSGYWYYRNDALNSNTWHNIRDGVAKPALLQNQPGGRVGGPIVIPGLYDGHNKAFFFVNYEEFRQPSETIRLRTILSPEAQAGIFRYNAGGGVAAVNLYALAAANGVTATPDPVVKQLLSDIRSASMSTGAITDLADPNLQRFTYNVLTTSHNYFPTVRGDYNLSENHRLTGSLNYQKYTFYPDTLNNREPFFPGFPAAAGQNSIRYGISTSLRSTLSANIVNELRVGGSGAPVKFFDEFTASMWSGSVANQGGFRLGLNNALITNASGTPSPSSRNAYTWELEDTVNWQKGSHGLNLGASYSEVLVWLKNQTLVPDVTLDVLQGTPAKAVFSDAANFPGSSTTNRGDAEDLYAVLVGSISAIDGDARINSGGTYDYLGQSYQEGKLRDVALWAQDAWRPRPDLTINLGVRWELQTPFQALNDSYSQSTLEDVWGISGLSSTCTDASAVTPANCNIFKPGTQPGKAITQYYALGSGVDIYKMDWNNIAPSVGAAWTPSAETGWLASFLGSPGDSVIRVGWSRAFQRNGMGDFTGRLDDNPGLIIQDVDRDESRGNILPPGATELLLRTPALLGPAPFPTTRNYPMTDSVTEDVDVFDPNLQVPYADTWSAGWQRAIGRNHAVEVRYVGTRSRDLWATYNYNELNILENGVYGEFLLAQQNLRANILAGRGANFRYFGPGTGTSPLPIAVAYFGGRTDHGNTAAYSSSSFASSTFVNPLAAFNPNPFTFANNLDSTSGNRANALTAGLPANFLVANPNKLGGADVAGNRGYTNYHSLQIEFRRRMSQGLQFGGSYVFGRAYQGDFYSLRVPLVSSLDGGTEGGVTHAFKGNWVYELPFGQGRRFGGNVGRAMDLLVGGWQVHGAGRFQSGRIINFGDINLVGMTIDDLKDMYRFRVSDAGIVTMLPQDVIDNSIKAFSVSATSATGYGSLGAPEGRYMAPASGPNCIETIATGYGSCGTRDIEFSAPWIRSVDVSVVKLFPIKGRVRAEFRIEMLNALNTLNYTPVTGVGSTTAVGYEVTGQAIAPRIVQLVWRVSW